MEQTVNIPDSDLPARPMIPTGVAPSHPGFQKFIGVVQALEPLILAGESPFIKNSGTQALIAAESPLAQAFLSALKLL